MISRRKSGLSNIATIFFFHLLILLPIPIHLRRRRRFRTNIASIRSLVALQDAICIVNDYNNGTLTDGGGGGSVIAKRDLGNDRKYHVLENMVM
jgi:hypothetical protein